MENLADSSIGFAENGQRIEKIRYKLHTRRNSSFHNSVWKSADLGYSICRVYNQYYIRKAISNHFQLVAQITVNGRTFKAVDFWYVIESIGNRERLLYYFHTICQNFVCHYCERYFAETIEEPVGNCIFCMLL